MIKVLSITLASALLTFTATQAVSADLVYFKAPVEVNGTGCPAGSVTAVGENTDTLTVMFSKYDAAKPLSKAASKLERSACNFAVPVHVPQGFQVSLMTIDWEGSAEGSTELGRSYFFAGQRGPQKVTHPSGNFTERDGLLAQTLAYSPCGKDVQLRINSSVTAKGNPSYISVEKAVNFKLQFRACR
jgi:hypothetical protein